MQLPNQVHIIGSGGREHALAWRIRKEAPDVQITAAPGNVAWSNIGVASFPEIPVKDSFLQLDLAKSFNSELVIVGPEAPLIHGIADLLRDNGLIVYGPSAAAAQIEASKAFFAEFAKKWNIPTPESVTFDSLDTALAYIAGRDPKSYVIKASGDAAGKGVVLPQSEAEAEETIRAFMVHQTLGVAGTTIVMQQRLVGLEFSAQLISDGWIVRGCPQAQDHKRLGEGDTGPNSGGIGAIASVHQIDYDIALRIGRNIIRRMSGEGIQFVGTMFLGCILTEDGVKVLEVNCRWGDPETETLMMLAHSGLLANMYAAAHGPTCLFKTDEDDGAHRLVWESHHSSSAATVVLAADGYPATARKGEVILGALGPFWANNPHCQLFHMGTKIEGGELVTNGGRVLAVSARGWDYEEALKLAYEGVAQISFPGMQYRRDIGHQFLRDLETGRIGRNKLLPGA